MVSITSFKGLPLDYESFLAEKYGSFMTLCPYIEIYYPTHDIYYLLVSEDDMLVDLIVFGNKGNSSVCFNSLTSIDQSTIKACNQYIFERFPDVKTIKISATYNEYRLTKSFLISKANDFVIDLPSTMDDFYANLGKSTRKNIRNRNAALTRDYPEVRFVTKQGAEIDENVIDKIVQLSYDRMRSKGIIPGKNHSDTHAFFLLAQRYGCVTYLEIDGQIVAGSIAYIVSKKIFLYMIAHDNNFSTYDVGFLCNAYTIQVSIEKGLKTAHFLWGENEHKVRLMAKPHPLYSYQAHKAYSLNFLLKKCKAMISRAIIIIRLSKYSKPLRDAIKSYRRKRN